MKFLIGMFLTACALLAIASTLNSCTTVSTDPKSGVQTVRQFNPPPEVWTIVGDFIKTQTAPKATPVVETKSGK